MELEEVLSRVNRVQQAKTLSAAAEAERTLWYAVLSAIAHSDTSNPQGIAMAAMQTIDVTTPENLTSKGVL